LATCETDGSVERETGTVGRARALATIGRARDEEAARERIEERIMLTLACMVVYI
jgi:hypothetical protein